MRYVGLLSAKNELTNVLIFKTDDLQEWFERSYFGALQGERYPNQQQEMQQFEIALKAIVN